MAKRTPAGLCREGFGWHTDGWPTEVERVLIQTQNYIHPSGSVLRQQDRTVFLSGLR
jgi:hypothetical protein